MPARRLIPCLDVRDGKVVKGVKFRNHRVVGDIVELAARYCAEGADELVFYDISASPAGRTVDRQWISRVAEVLDVPFCVAGGIRSVEDAEAVLNRGADKISINSPALHAPELISQLAKRFGTQCVVVGIDSRAVDGDYVVYQNTGDPEKAAIAGRRTMDWIDEVQHLGAGEIVLNCMNQDGVRQGYDIEQLRQARQRCRIPLVASGGAGSIEHFADVFESTGVDAALAASVFHDGDISIPSLKHFLSTRGIEIRVDERQPDRASWQQTILSS
ncbi:MAG: imidazole glycerol phosphate synthase subunit HisF [Gammaproteobacteria bacterium]|nr:imidazole glycerol phosphate synthase subunit HisF [Gammaproteobacteria bacterium]